MPHEGKSRQHRVSGMIFALALVGSFAASHPVHAQSAAPAQAPTTGNTAFSYADLADLALPAQIIAGVTVAKTERLKGELAPGLAPRQARFLIQATTGMLLKGADGLAGSLSYIVDVPLNAKGKAPKLRKARFILIADRVVGRPQEVRLTSPHSQIEWTQPNESRLRSILTEASSAGAPPPVTGVGNAFHVPGAIPGESESQIFLTTSNNRPISLTVLRRPGEQPHWSVALSEIIDESARAPASETLLWYRLACFLPRRIPQRSIATLAEREASAVREDYRLVIEKLGPCGRTIQR